MSGTSSSRAIVDVSLKEATAELGIPEAALTVHDFEVRTFPERRQDILELLIALWDDWKPDAVELGRYDHYMQKEIFEQPKAVEESRVLEPGQPSHPFDPDEQLVLGPQRRAAVHLGTQVLADLRGGRGDHPGQGQANGQAGQCAERPR